jgi:hypothetical protein
MVWFVVDDVLPFHERVIRAGNAAMGLWVRAGAYCSGQLTDGFITTEAARAMGSAAEIKRLVTVGLWQPEQRDGLDGYLFHAWAEDGTGTKRQQTRAEVEERRRKERERKAAQRQSRKDDQQDSGKPSTPPPPTVPRGVPVGQPAGRAPDVRSESRGASEYPVQSSPNQAQETHVSPSSHLPDREGTATDDESDRARRDGYWRGWAIQNPLKVVSLLIEVVERPVTEDQAISIVAGILAKAKRRPDSIERYVLGAIRQSWAEIQQELDEAAVAA